MQYSLKRRNLFLVLMVFILAFVGCQTTAQKAKNFVDQYNNEIKMSNSGISMSSHAQLVSDKKIRVFFQTNYNKEDDGFDFLKSSASSILISSLPDIKLLNNLFEDGVEFEYVLLAKDKSIIGSTLINKKLYDEYTKTAEGSANVKDKNLSSTEIQFEKMLVMLNRQLPYTEPSTGVKITQIFSKKNALVYKSEMPDQLAKNYNGETTLILMKAEIIKSDKVKTALSSMEEFNINKLIYRYYRTNGKLLAEIPVEKKDLLPN